MKSSSAHSPSFTKKVKSISLALLFTGLLLGTELCHADIQADLTACGNAPGANTLTMEDCMEKLLTRENAALNTEYKKAMAQATASDADTQPPSTINQSSLKKSEQTWMAFRDAEVASDVASFGGGSIVGIIRLSTLVTMTNTRTAQLTADFSQQ